MNPVPEQEQGSYSDYQVMCSHAGWYVGTLWTDPDGFESPGSRESPYFGTKEEADAYLHIIVED